MEQSNISRDHIALEAMKIMYGKMSFSRLSLIERIRKWLGLSVNDQRYTSCGYYFIARESYKLADAMLAERDKDKEE